MRAHVRWSLNLKEKENSLDAALTAAERFLQKQAASGGRQSLLMPKRSASARLGVSSANGMDQVLSAAAFAYCATPHTITKYSPYFLVSGQNMVLPLSRSWGEPVLSRTGSLWLRALWQCRI